MMNRMFHAGLAERREHALILTCDGCGQQFNEHPARDPDELIKLARSENWWTDAGYISGPWNDITFMCPDCIKRQRR